MARETVGKDLDKLAGLINQMAKIVHRLLRMTGPDDSWAASDLDRLESQQERLKGIVGTDTQGGIEDILWSGK